MADRKVAFITGASRGLGRACALELARRGFDLVLTARTVSGAERLEHSSTVRRLPPENPGRVCATLATATDPMFFSGRDVHGPTCHAEHALTRFA